MLARNSIIYLGTQIINKSIPFFLLPILTKYLTPEDYGVIAIFNTYMVFLTVFIGLGMPSFINVNFFKMSKRKFSFFLNAIVFGVLFSSIVLFTLETLFSNILSYILKIEYQWMIIGVVVVLMKVYSTFILTVWRAQENPVSFALFEVFQMILNVTITLVLILYLGMNWEGRIIGISVSTIFFGLISFFVLYNKFLKNSYFSMRYLKNAWKFGLPMIFHSLAIWGKSGIDIFFISTIVGLAQTGIYSLGYQLGAIVGVFSTAYISSFTPFMYKKMKSNAENDRVTIVKYSYVYFFSIILLSIFFSLFFYFTIPFLLDDRYIEARNIVPYIAMAHAFQGINYIFMNIILYKEKTGAIAKITIKTTSLHIILSYFFIHNFGEKGAAFATLVSFFVTLFLIWRKSIRFYELPWFKYKYLLSKSE